MLSKLDHKVSKEIITNKLPLDGQAYLLVTIQCNHRCNSSCRNKVLIVKMLFLMITAKMYLNFKSYKTMELTLTLMKRDILFDKHNIDSNVYTFY